MKDLIIEELSEYDYKMLCINGKVLKDVFYMTYYDKRTCMLCLKEYKRRNVDENPNFCLNCLTRLKIKEVMENDGKRGW